MYVSEDGVTVIGKNRINPGKIGKQNRRLSDLISFSRENSIANTMTGIIINSPNILEFFLSENEMVVDLPRNIANKIKSGEYTFSNAKDGSIKAQVRDVKTGQIVRNLDLKEISKVSEITSLANMAATAALYAQLKTLENKIDKVNKGVETLIKSLENDRLARVISVSESMSQALSIKNDSIRKKMLVNTLNEALKAKNMFYKQIEMKVKQLMDDEKQPKRKRMSADEGNQKAKEILNDFYPYSEAYKIQMRCYIELEEYTALSLSIGTFYEQIENIYSDDIKVEIDGSFEKTDNLYSKSVNELLLSLENMETNIFENIRNLDNDVYKEIAYSGGECDERS